VTKANEFVKVGAQMLGDFGVTQQVLGQIGGIFTKILASTPNVKTSLTFSFSALSYIFEPNSQSGFNLAGFVGSKGFRLAEIQANMLTVIGASYDVILDFSKGGNALDKTLSIFGSFSKLGGNAFSASTDFSNKGRLKSLTLSAGYSRGTSWGISTGPVDQDSLPNFSWSPERKL